MMLCKGLARGCLCLFGPLNCGTKGPHVNSHPHPPGEGPEQGCEPYVHPGGDALQQEIHAAQHHLTACRALGVHEAGRSFCNSSC